MKSDLPPKTYEAPTPGLACPICESRNTYYSCKHQKHHCNNCSELFSQEEAFGSPPAPPLKLCGG